MKFHPEPFGTTQGKLREWISWVVGDWYLLVQAE